MRVYNRLFWNHKHTTTPKPLALEHILKKCTYFEGEVVEAEIVPQNLTHPHRFKIKLADNMVIKGHGIYPKDRPINVGESYYFYTCPVRDYDDAMTPFISTINCIYSYGKVGELPFNPLEELKKYQAGSSE